MLLGSDASRRDVPSRPSARAERPPSSSRTARVLRLFSARWARRPGHAHRVKSGSLLEARKRCRHFLPAIRVSLARCIQPLFFYLDWAHCPLRWCFKTWWINFTPNAVKYRQNGWWHLNNFSLKFIDAVFFCVIVDRGLRFSSLCFTVS